eukprot:TRINITY_DN95260_c0_g1_i1.p2 TRINITY_DN95260_c0_g1~~TRINITY_DN95260_c0_g1_i1.p2  ORF type:complete len:274 (+),score=151.36 TRINITY_DN95260_c0_g1_i1:768-1589(+)
MAPTQLYYLLYLLCDVAGLVVSPFFFGFHLMDIVLHNHTLWYVIQATMKRPKQIMATMLFGVILLYLFSIFGFVFFQGEYTFGDHDLTYRCDTFLECVQEHWDYGFRDPPVWNDPHQTLLPTLYDLSFFFLINILIVSLITAIIIDTFSEMRSKKDRLEEQIENHCFVCGIDRETFDFHGHGFKSHCHEDHYMWNYVYLRKYLRDKVFTELTGQEQYLHRMFAERNINFLPVKRALVLEEQQHRQRQQQHQQQHQQHQQQHQYHFQQQQQQRM